MTRQDSTVKLPLENWANAIQNFRSKPVDGAHEEGRFIAKDGT